MTCFLFLLLLAINNQFFVYAGPASPRPPPRHISPALGPSAPRSIISLIPRLEPQQTTSRQSTCGFKDGDPDQARTADPGFDCRVDTQNALWGFCPTTVITATDCGLAGNCVDLHACTSGCGIFGDSRITTFTCSVPGSDFCSSAILTAGVDQTFTNIACGPSGITDHLLATSTTSQELSSISLATPTPTPAASSTVVSPPSTSTPSSLTSPSSVVPTNSPNVSGVSNAAPNNTGAIVGGVIGGVALIAFVGIAFMFVRRYRARPANTLRPQSENMVLNDRSSEMLKSSSANGQTLSELPSYPAKNTVGPVELPGHPSGTFHNRGS